MHDAACVPVPVCARELARLCGLRVQPASRGGASLEDGVIYYDHHARSVRQHGLIAHEVAHYVLQAHGEDDTEEAARYTAGALMLPRDVFDRDLRATAWDLEQLRARHPNASAQLIARRVSELREAVITVLDQGRVTSRVASPGLPAPGRMTALERELADAALASGTPQRAHDFLGAWPYFDAVHRRVIVIADAQQLALEF